MGFITGLFKTAAFIGVVGYCVGRKGARAAAKYAGATLGHSVGRTRRARGALQAAAVAQQTPEEAAAAKSLQRGWWELRMIMNEVTMLRSLNPRLLQAGNFGFTDAEVLTAIGKASPDFAEDQAIRNAHVERQLDLERQQLENPRMWPIAGNHGTGNDAEAFAAATAQGASTQAAGPGVDILRKPGPGASSPGRAGAPAMPEPEQVTTVITGQAGVPDGTYVTERYTDYVPGQFSQSARSRPGMSSSGGGGGSSSEIPTISVAGTIVHADGRVEVKQIGRTISSSDSSSSGSSSNDRS